MTRQSLSKSIKKERMRLLSPMGVLVLVAILIISIVISGIAYLVGIVDWSNVPFNYWFLACVVGAYVGYRIRFKNNRALKFYILRRFVEMNARFKRIDKKVIYGKEIKLTPLQDRSLKIWKVLLRDPETVLYYSPTKRQRQVKSDNILIVLNEYVDYHNLIMFDTSSVSVNFYEVRISVQYSGLLIDSFDLEMDRRMLDSEESHRKLVEATLDVVLQQKEELLKNKKTQI